MVVGQQGDCIRRMFYFLILQKNNKRTVVFHLRIYIYVICNIQQFVHKTMTITYGNKINNCMPGITERILQIICQCVSRQNSIVISLNNKHRKCPSLGYIIIYNLRYGVFLAIFLVVSFIGFLKTNKRFLRSLHTYTFLIVLYNFNIQGIL